MDKKLVSSEILDDNNDNKQHVCDKDHEEEYVMNSLLCPEAQKQPVDDCSQCHGGKLANLVQKKLLFKTDDKESNTTDKGQSLQKKLTKAITMNNRSNLLKTEY